MTNSAKIYAGLKPNVPMISYQGAEILNHSDYSILNSVEMDKKYISEVLNVIKFFPVKAMIQYSNQIYYDTDDGWIQDYALRNNVDLILDKNYIEAQQRDPLRMVMVGEPGIIINLEIALKSQLSDDLYITRSLPHFCEVLNKFADKSFSIDWICEKLDINIEKTLAFGDSYNDIKMLQNVGYGVAVFNAVEELKNVADQVLDIDGNFGIIDFLNKTFT
jgi:hypothetical protein|tara:strand:+ start:986 stop:1642 length:657 start_codon:yes stop_codon:yes gene_type:complete